MSYDPVSEVLDEPLSVTKSVIVELCELRASEKFTELPGVDTTEERARLCRVFDGLLERLVEGVVDNPRKIWVMKQFQVALEAVAGEDTEAREHFGAHLEKIMDAFGIESSDGLLSFYLG